MKQQTLFVGNGPNRLGVDSHSWDAVLQRLAEFSQLEDVFAERKDKPFTLLFEEMAIRSADKGLSGLELKAKVAEWMRELAPNSVHERLLAFDKPHLLTTNYDYGLEGPSHGFKADFSNESRYSLFRCREVGQTRVWHLHGEIDSPDTITLGYEHYVGHLHKTRNYLSLESSRELTGPSDHRSPVMHKEYRFEDRTDTIYSWVDVFLRDDIHIAGFGCDYSEIDIWWLLSMKERLRQRDRRLAKGINVGRTIFYHLQQPYLSARKRALLAALRNFGVELVAIPVDAHYSDGWDKLCEHLKSLM